MLRRFAALALLLSATGCTVSTLRDTTTVHNPDATRIWIVQGLGDDQYVVFCDMQMHQQTQRLCIRWPALVVSNDGAQPPTTPAPPPAPSPVPR